MQLYAFDRYRQIVIAQKALRGINYWCLECDGVLRLKAGSQRQPHFFHVNGETACRQHQKSAAHIAAQLYFFRCLPEGDCCLEYRMESIGRIADVAWLSQKIVFEIQCSSISVEEVMQRNGDYQQEGWQVVWILHDQRFNQKRLSAVETALRSHPHYFTNISEEGRGEVYDQFDICEGGWRIAKLGPLPLCIGGGSDVFPFFSSTVAPVWILKERKKAWPLFFSGDLCDQFNQAFQSDYCEEALKIEGDFLCQKEPLNSWKKALSLFWKKGMKEPYEALHGFILEKMCR